MSIGYNRKGRSHFLEGSLDRFDALRTLVHAADGGSLTAASRALGMPLPTVSRKVAELEAHIGARLLVRTSRRIVLTEAGQAFIPAARRILADLEEAERVASGEYREPRGELLVTAPIAFGRLHIMPVVADFLRVYPKVGVRLVLSDTVIDLVESHIDVGVRLGRLPDSGLVARKVGEVRWITVASPAYLAARGTPHAPADLSTHDCLAFEGLNLSRSWTFATGPDSVTVAIAPRLGVNTADALIEAAASDLGIARVTTYQAAGAIRGGRLISILRRYEPEPVPVHLVHTGLPLPPLKLRAFLDFAAPRLRQSIASLPD